MHVVRGCEHTMFMNATELCWRLVGLVTWMNKRLADTVCRGGQMPGSQCAKCNHLARVVWSVAVQVATRLTVLVQNFISKTCPISRRAIQRFLACVLRD